MAVAVRHASAHATKTAEASRRQVMHRLRYVGKQAIMNRRQLQDGAVHSQVGCT
jgi:hypothetical protein